MEEIRVMIEITLPGDICFSCMGHNLAKILDFYNTDFQTRDKIRGELKKIARAEDYVTNCVICKRKVNCVNPDQ